MTQPGDHAPTITIRPQDDLYGWANEEWLATAEIPDDRAAYGAFHELVDAAEQHMRRICEDAADDVAATGVRRLVGDLYASFLDEERSRELGIAPLTAPLAHVESISSIGDLISALADHQRHGGSGLVELFVMPDATDPERNLLHLEQGGLGLPDQSYYVEDTFAKVRTAYVEHVAAMLGLAGEAADFVGDPHEAAQTVMDVETAIASHHWDVVRTRDALATHNLRTIDQLEQEVTSLEWRSFFTGVGATQDAAAQVVVRQPSFLEGAATLLTTLPLSSWRTWLCYHVISDFAPYLSPEMVEEKFAFYGRTLSGTPALRPRWKRAVSFVEHAAGEAAGQLYVEQYFPPEAKAAMNELVDNLVEAYRRNIATLEWMSEETRQRALEKLAAFRPKVGYPDRWRDYTGLIVERDDLVGNVRRAAAFETARELAKIGAPVDRDEWFMTPQTVNAYYNPLMNEIVFPAAILQPPFFGLDADVAANYGGIGAVIGHEIGHGFDDQGSRYNGRGALSDWWTESDRARFEEKAATLVAQFDVLEPRDLPGHTVNGALTVGENIGDLGGVAVALQAYRIATGAKTTAEDIDGHRQFFEAFGSIWRSKVRAEEELRRLTTDPHSPAEFRANIVRNVDAFHESFDVTKGDGLWLDPDERVRIW